jgi:Ice-binding-like
MTDCVNPRVNNEPGRVRRRPHARRCAAGLLIALLVTAASTSTAQAASVSLATAESFAVLAGSTVTNTGPSVISGDLGLSPGTAVTGFPPGTVSEGSVHRTDAVALQAQRDLTSAYDDAAGRSSTATISADLAGKTLAPGVYTSASSLGLSGALTLDARGDPNAVFVFQAGSMLTVGSTSQVLLIGGAQACNVIWQVGSSASIGANSAFAGTILALTSISLTTGATLNGRALARNGQVSLDTNTVTRTACAAQPSTPPTTTPRPGDGTGTPDAGDSSSASARLHGPSGCVRRPFRARVSGREIAQVTFFVDATRRATVKAKTGQTVFSIRLDPRGQNVGMHRITAKVRFTADSATKARTLRLVYQRCSTTAGRPRFTG